MLLYSSLGLGCHLTIEDDDNVCYAYLLRNNRIVGDVWLYNRGHTPESVDWADKSLMPFKNPLGYAAEGAAWQDAIDDNGDLKIEWESLNGLMHVFIYFKGWLLAVLVDGSMPGYNSLAAADGPLAKVMPEHFLNRV